MNALTSSPTRLVLFLVGVLAVVGVSIALIVVIVGRSAEPAPASADEVSVADGVVADSVIAGDTSMGAVSLAVRDAETMREYYSDVIGLEVLAEGEGVTTLGAGGEELLHLIDSDADPDSPSNAGLYHTAFLYADRPALAAALVRVAERAPNTFQGSADHSVSLAFYFGDPEGNGIELYTDRNRDEWQWNAGEVTMGSAALNPNSFITQFSTSATQNPDPIVGHVHLRLGDIPAAEEFYEDTLGFGVTSRSADSLFLSAGGYHHHLAANTWSSLGAGVRPETLGLRQLVVRVTDAAELDAAAARLDTAGVAFERVDGTLTVDDPWGNTVRLVLVG